MAGAVQFGLAAALALAIIGAGSVVARRRADLMLGILAMSVPVQTLIVLPVGEWSVTATKLSLASLAIGWGSRSLRAPIAVDRVAWGYACVVVALAGSIVAVDDLLSWASVVYQWSAALVVYVVARSELRTRAAVEVVLGGMAIGVTGVAAVAIGQVAMGDGPSSFVTNGLLRAYGTFGEPNPLAAYMELTVPLLAAFLVARRATRNALRNGMDGSHASLVLAVTGAGVVAGAVTLALTQSTGGLLGFGAGATMLALLLPSRWRLWSAMAGGLIAATVLLTPVGTGWWERGTDAVATFQDRVHVTPVTWSAQERRAHWGAAAGMLREHPATGVGAGEFDREFRQHTPEWRFRTSRGHAHNGYLQLAAEAGLPGMIAFLAWCGATLTGLGGRLLRLEGGVERALVVGAAACMVAFMVHSVVDYLNVLSLGIQIALLIALGMTGYGVGNERHDGRGGVLRSPIAVAPA